MITLNQCLWVWRFLVGLFYFLHVNYTSLLCSSVDQYHSKPSQQYRNDEKKIWRYNYFLISTGNKESIVALRGTLNKPAGYFESWPKYHAFLHVAKNLLQPIKTVSLFMTQLNTHVAFWKASLVLFYLKKQASTK